MGDPFLPIEWDLSHSIDLYTVGFDLSILNVGK